MKPIARTAVSLLLFATSAASAAPPISTSLRIRKFAYTFVNGSCTGVEDLFFKPVVPPVSPIIKVSPNITHTNVDVQLRSDSIDVQDIVGKTFYVVSLDGLVQKTGTINQVPETIDFSGLNEGQYLLIIGDEKYQEEFKIIKK